MNAVNSRGVVSGSGRFTAENPKLGIWLRNEGTDPGATKEFNRGGGFKGTATNATYIVKRLTAEFGPVGIGWGYEVETDDVLQGAPVLDQGGEAIGYESVHRLRIRFWYRHPETGERGEFSQMGQTTLVGKNKHGLFTDEEAPKKSLTDAITKAASWLGFAADIHLGLWDDNRYVAHRRDLEATDGKQQGAPLKQAAPPQRQADAVDRDEIPDFDERAKAGAINPAGMEWPVLSRDGSAEVAADRAKWIGVWRFRVDRVVRATKQTPEMKRRTLHEMQAANAPVFADLRARGDDAAVDEVLGLIAAAGAKLRQAEDQFPGDRA